MPKWLLIFIGLLWTATGCVSQPPGPPLRPSPNQLPATSAAPLPNVRPQSPLSMESPTASALVPPEPHASFFSELPQHFVGETVQAGGYQITLKQAAVVDGQLRVVLDLENRSKYDIDLGWAVQVRDAKGTLIRPDTVSVQGKLAAGGQVQQVWQRQAGVSVSEVNTMRLIYAPHGWSGPVFVFRLGK